MAKKSRNNRKNTSNKSNNNAAADPIQTDILADLSNVDTTTFVGAIDQGTSSTRFLLFDVEGVIVASAQMEHPQKYPKSGWHEHDPLVLWSNTVECITAVHKELYSKKAITLDATNLKSIGITNQRETTIAWNQTTGQPYYNAIVWDDTRTSSIANAIEKADWITKTTGLPMSSYFAGTKVKWLLDNVESLRHDVETDPDQVCFGTVDSWLLFQLTGTTPKSEATGRKLKGKAGSSNLGGLFQTDVTNASRWLFMDLQSCGWNQECMNLVTAPHTLPLSVLPEIRPSSGVFGTIADCGLPASLMNIPIASILGDQQAALFGQAAFQPGQAKNTYGTGLFLMMNTGDSAVPSTHGLLTTVAYQLNGGKVQYALEGSVSHSGSTIQWLRDNLNIIKNAADSETQARRVSSNDDLYFVPAFAGLFAPHWRSDARGCLVGMTTKHHKGHVCRAALEATAYQTKEVFDAIVKDMGKPLTQLNVDGGGTHNKLLMQFQADMINVPVVKPKVMETTSMGAAFAAGLAVDVWKDLEEIQKLWAVAETYKPKMSNKQRKKNLAGWNKAVSKSLNWVGGHDQKPAPPVMNGGSSKQTQKKPPPVVVETPVEDSTPQETAPSQKETTPSPMIKKREIAVPEKTVDTSAETSDETVPYVGDLLDFMPHSPPSNNKKPALDNHKLLAATAAAALAVGTLLGRISKK